MLMYPVTLTKRGVVVVHARGSPHSESVELLPATVGSVDAYALSADWTWPSTKPTSVSAAGGQVPSNDGHIDQCA